MGLYTDQTKARLQADKDAFDRSIEAMESALKEKNTHMFDAAFTQKGHSLDAMGEILSFYKIETRYSFSDDADINDHFEYMLSSSGVMRRSVTLTDKWWKDASGPMLAHLKTGSPIALIPSKGGYVYFDHDEGKQVRVNYKSNEFILQHAVCFYRPLPSGEVGLKELFRFIIKSLDKSDIFYIVITTFFVSLLGMITPYMNKLIFSYIIPAGELRILAVAGSLLFGVMAGKILILTTKQLSISRINSKIIPAVRSAVMARILYLPAPFFRKYNAGGLSSIVSKVKELCRQIINAVFSSGMTALFSFIYLFQIYNYAPSLFVPATLIILIQLAAAVVMTMARLDNSKKLIEVQTRITGTLYALFEGIQKIKIAGAERRAFARWGGEYRKQVSYKFNPPLIVKIQANVLGIIASIGTVIIYFCAAKSQVSVADYMAFFAAYGMVSSAILALTPVVTAYTSAKPVLDLIKPILTEIPENSQDKKIVTCLQGSIQIENIDFRYDENSPWIFQNLSLAINAGQYVAIVGKTGCGKSTLLRILLGFEEIQKGAVYYDGKDIAGLDKRTLRKNIGSVMQDGKLFPGDIFSNIVLSAPWLTLESAWEAAGIAGIADDIAAMPMGMHTTIAESSRDISGGQKQRLMIARAVAPKPKILLFDEATSALDNVTQKKVSDALENLKCTRIVVAHRLSTIKNCDRIIVMDQGRIVEEGTYHELIEANGFFADLISRQIL